MLSSPCSQWGDSDSWTQRYTERVTGLETTPELTRTRLPVQALVPTRSRQLPLEPQPRPSEPGHQDPQPTMKFLLDDMEFVFPYDKMYPEQYSYVCDLKRSLDAHVRPSAA